MAGNRRIWLILWFLAAGSCVGMWVRSQSHIDEIRIPGTAFYFSSHEGIAEGRFSNYKYFPNLINLNGTTRNTTHKGILYFSAIEPAVGIGKIYAINISWLLIATAFTISGLLPFWKALIIRFHVRRSNSDTNNKTSTQQ